MRPFLFLTLPLSLLLLSSTVALSQAPAAADTYVSASAGTTNFGTSTLLTIQPNVRPYIKFDLDGIPADATVQKAVLRLFVSGYSGSGNITIDAYEIDSPWTESGLTWNNQPALGDSATGNSPITVSSSSKGQFVLLDITALVQNWISGEIVNNGIALAPTSGSLSVSFDSKEATATSHEPALLIAIPGGPGQQGPLGPPGPQGPEGVPGNLNPGSPYYIQNGTAVQASTSFSVDGSGTVGGVLQGNSVNAINTSTNQAYSIAGSPILGVGSTADRNVFLGAGAGQSNISGSGVGNLFAGFNAGNANSNGISNVLAGNNAGVTNTGSFNSFLGSKAGDQNTSGSSNLYIANEGCPSPVPRATPYESVRREPAMHSKMQRT